MAPGSSDLTSRAPFGLPIATGLATAAIVTATAADRTAGIGLGIAFGVTTAALTQLVTTVRRTSDALTAMGAPLTLAALPRLLERHKRSGEALTKIAARPDPLFRELAFARLDRIKHELDSLAGGTVVFQSTETWRIA